MTPKLLVVDDEPDNFSVIAALLASEGYELHFAANGIAAIEQTSVLEPDLILLDLMMPIVDGADVARWIKSGELTRFIPVIMVTALPKQEALAHCLEHGADDFIAKPVSGAELRARVRSMLRIRRMHLENAARCQKLVAANDWLAEINLSLDQQVQAREADLLRRIMFHPLTGLPSRTLLRRRLFDALRQRRDDLDLPQFGLVYLDCAQFKMINASYGARIGDKLLIEIGRRLLAALGQEDLLAHADADEFCVVLGHVGDTRALELEVARLLRCFDQPFDVASHEVFAQAYAGAVLSGAYQSDPADMLRDAETALHGAKLRGMGSQEIFHPALNCAALARISLEHDLRLAMSQGDIQLHYQPIVRLENGAIYGLEALARWQHPVRGRVPPAEFIDCAEKSGLIVPLDRVLLEQVCRQAQSWLKHGVGALRLAVNLSARQFRHPNLIADIDRITSDTGVDPTHLEIEVTESVLMESPEDAIGVLRQLKARGITLSLDDFGTGYSSLGYVQRFPFDNLKVDRSFTAALSEHPRNASLVEAILSMSRALGIAVIAEGIETGEQRSKMMALGATFGQGFYFSAPRPAEEVPLLLSDLMRPPV